jgi:hypothetical protein
MRNKMDWSWREYIKYPGAIGYGSRKGVLLMDTLEELIPFEPFAKNLVIDRLMKFSRWIDAGEKAGLLTYCDASEIRQELIHGCGGL